jgi:heat shock protein HspQ
MSNNGGIILNVTPEAPNLARELNRVVKKHRNKNRPFLMLIVEDNGTASVVSNMTNEGERLQLLKQTIMGLLGQGRG